MIDHWRDRSVLVTGATGFLGGWMVRRLLELKALVVCLVRDSVADSMLYLRGDHLQVIRVTGDVSNQQLMERVLGEYDVQTVLHLAAQTIVGVANRNPISTLESNVRGTWTVLEACRRSPKVKSVVVASSDKAYGDQAQQPYTEDMPLQGAFPYDASKSCADLIAQSYACTYKLPVAITRCANLFGGGDLNWNRLVPGTIRSVLRNERPVIRSDGKAVRDWLHVSDAVTAYLTMAEALEEGETTPGSAFNFSLEMSATALDVVNAIRQLAGSKVQPLVCGEDLYEIREQRLDSSKARQVLGWRPDSTFTYGLTEAIAWYREHLQP